MVQHSLVAHAGCRIIITTCRVRVWYRDEVICVSSTIEGHSSGSGNCLDGEKINGSPFGHKINRV